jgi:hypothetical protein
LEAFETQHDIDRITKTLADVIVDWNCNKMYKSTGGDKQKEGNCQDFVDDILERLNIKKKTDGPVGEFLNTLRKKGTCEMVYKMNSDFCKQFETTPKIKFKSHEQLDLFTKKLLLVDPQFRDHHAESWYLLKSYDRAFWLKHYKFPTDARFKPAPDEVSDDELCEGERTEKESDGYDCPFQDPKRTFSIRVMRDINLK